MRSSDIEQKPTETPPHTDDVRARLDPRTEPGIRGTAARVPYWLIVGGFVIFALIVIYLAWFAWPAG